MEFSQIFKIDVNEKTEKRKSSDHSDKELTYLSWAWAWAEFKKIYPRATYEIKIFDGKPFIYDEKTGYMVWTSVTADELTYEMWLPVMDGNNRAMKSTPYEISTKKGYKINVQAATMFDVNKAIMRCLAKNLAMFGLGLYIYAGEDLPEAEENQTETKTVITEKQEFATGEQKEQLRKLIGGAEYAKLMNACGGKLPFNKYEELINGTKNL